MNTANLLHTPEGVRDIYGNEYDKKIAVEEKIHRVFSNRLYRDIQTPTFEYFDVFSSEIGTTSSKELYKFYDDEGNTLVLRPDFTPSVARCAANYFLEGDRPVRLTYQGNTFTNISSLQGKLREVTEMGVELLNDGSVAADAEMISLAVEVLKESGLKDFKICLGNAEYFRGICRQVGVSEATELMLRDLISVKNIYGAETYLAEQKLSAEDKKLLLSVTDFFGGKEVLDEALGIAKDRGSIMAVERLKELSEELIAKDLKQYISFDLGMLSKYNYYTGVIFKAYTFGIGNPIIKGGRYDHLLSYFGKDAPAIGFAIVIDDLLDAIKGQDQAYAKNDKKYLTFALAKGRLASKTMELFEKMGITLEEMKDKDSRKLVFTDKEHGLQFFLAKGPDVPTYVEYGAADIGVVGKDTIVEEDREVFEVMDLGFGKCRMCVCGPKEKEDLLAHREQIRVASKYPRIAKDYFLNKKRQTVDIIKLNGSVELGPIVGLSDFIVDIVETGSTLRENGLDVLEEIMPLSARMIVNPVSMQMESEKIKDIIGKIKELLKEDKE